MARPRSEDKRQALLDAAVRVITDRGLGAATAAIAQEAAVSNGTLFLYFPTKADLFNRLYLELKSEMAGASLQGLEGGYDLRAQLEGLWTRWLAWSHENPAKRRALALLAVSEELTPESVQKGHEVMAPIASLLDLGRRMGPLHDAPLAYVVALMNGVAETTVAFMAEDPAHAADHRQRGFDALWRMVS